MYLSVSRFRALRGRLGVPSPMFFLNVGRQQCWTMPAGLVAFGVADHQRDLRPAGSVAFGLLWYLFVVLVRAPVLGFLCKSIQLNAVIIYVSQGL